MRPSLRSFAMPHGLEQAIRARVLADQGRRFFLFEALPQRLRRTYQVDARRELPLRAKGRVRIPPERRHPRLEAFADRSQSAAPKLVPAGRRLVLEQHGSAGMAFAGRAERLFAAWHLMAGKLRRFRVNPLLMCD